MTHPTPPDPAEPLGTAVLGETLADCSGCPAVIPHGAGSFCPACDRALRAAADAAAHHPEPED